VAKALAAGADAIVVDLEDAVPVQAKDTARAEVGRLLAGRDEDPVGGPELWVRVNPPGTDAGQRDLDALAGAPVDGLRVPMAEDPSAVREVGRRTGARLHLIVETAAGLARAGELARASAQVTGIALGEADLAADLMVGAPAGLPSPVQSVWTDVADTEGLRRSCRAGRDSGFWGRSVVHPRQLDVVHEVYTPTRAELAAAEEVVRTAEAAAARGHAAVLDAAGRFIDPAVVAQARVVLGRAARPAPSDPGGHPPAGHGGDQP
jgi:citrate lyase subunit beta/citryl-CoA lyase